MVAWLYNELQVIKSNLVHLPLSLLAVVVTVHNEQRSVLSQSVRHLDHYQTTYRQHHAKSSWQEGKLINHNTIDKDKQKRAEITHVIPYHHLAESHSNTTVSISFQPKLYDKRNDAIKKILHKVQSKYSLWQADAYLLHGNIQKLRAESPSLSATLTRTWRSNQPCPSFFSLWPTITCVTFIRSTASTSKTSI